MNCRTLSVCQVVIHLRLSPPPPPNFTRPSFTRVHVSCVIESSIEERERKTTVLLGRKRAKSEGLLHLLLNTLTKKTHRHMDPFVPKVHSFPFGLAVALTNAWRHLSGKKVTHLPVTRKESNARRLNTYFFHQNITIRERERERRQVPASLAGRMLFLCLSSSVFMYIMRMDILAFLDPPVHLHPR